MKNAYLYIVLWFTGCLVAAAIILMWDTTGDKDRLMVFDKTETGLENVDATNNIVNELLLSANELNIYGKSSLIEYNNRYEPETAELIREQIKTNPEKAYSEILKNKLKNLKRKSGDADFSVKPIPK